MGTQQGCTYSSMFYLACTEVGKAGISWHIVKYLQILMYFFVSFWLFPNAALFECKHLNFIKSHDTEFISISNMK